MLQSVLKKMCVFMWILTLSLNYIRRKNVDEAKFFCFFLWCLFKKKYIPAWKTSSRSAAAFSIFTCGKVNNFLFPSIVTAADLHVAQCRWLWQLLACTGQFYSCYYDDIIVVLHHLLFTHQTSDLVSFTFWTKPPTQTLLRGNVLIFQSDSSDSVEQLCSEGVQHWDRDIPPWY